MVGLKPDKFYLFLAIGFLIVSPVNSVHHQAQVSTKVQVVHPLQTMYRASTDMNPMLYYSYAGRGSPPLVRFPRMEFKPLLPKVLYTVGVLGEIMRGVGATVSEVLHRAAGGGFQGRQFGLNYYAPYHPYSTSSYGPSPYPFNRPQLSNQQHQQQQQLQPQQLQFMNGPQYQSLVDDPHEMSFDERHRMASTPVLAFQILPSQIEAVQFKPFPIEKNRTRTNGTVIVVAPRPTVATTAATEPNPNIIKVVAKAIAGA